MGSPNHQIHMQYLEKPGNKWTIMAIYYVESPHIYQCIAILFGLHKLKLSFNLNLTKIYYLTLQGIKETIIVLTSVLAVRTFTKNTTNFVVFLVKVLTAM